MNAITLNPTTTQPAKRFNLLASIASFFQSKHEPLTEFTDTEIPGEVLRPVGVQIINEGLHDSMAEDISERGFLACTEQVTVLYNPGSIDSVFAAGLLSCALTEASKVDMEAYTPMHTAPPNLKNTTHIVVVGVEMREDHLRELLKGTQAKVTLFGYRDSYEWLAVLLKSATAVTADRLRVFKPCSLLRENYGELMNRTDNTAIRQVYGYLCIAEEEGSVPEAFREAAMLASRLVSLAFPVASFDYPYGATSFSDKDINERAGEKPMDFGANVSQKEIMEKFREFEQRNRARIYNLLPSLRKALTGADHHAAMHRLIQANGTLAYAIIENDVRSAVGSSLVLDAAFDMPLIHAHEYQVSMVMSVLINTYKRFLTYEDHRGYRIWRIYNTDAAAARLFGLRFDAHASWSEGACWCVVTSVPMVQMAEHGSVSGWYKGLLRKRASKKAMKRRLKAYGM